MERTRPRTRANARGADDGYGTYFKEKPAYEIATLVEEQKTGRFAVGLLFWCFMIMLMDGYDQTAVSFAAPAIIKEWHVARRGGGPVFGAGLFGTLIGSVFLRHLRDPHLPSMRQHTRQC